ncbi:uncharacterized protein LOC123988574 [Osmia bicornis bicornis]|uniref:uncharacterized protein LOC123988574 n=1 Tax=Osmia bicornis bicornis TaxID=1437191 RepID=UPI001EAF2D02|nr:uncharacterized protein LOC123988574 [Osmia bicornis bicornis]XP_046145119.1 uncharacterized protein LOC123988574 [Osmia bicornis bicornis]
MHVLVPTLQYTYVYFYRQVKHLIPRMQNHYASEEDSLKGCHQNSVHGASPPVSASLCGNDKIRLVRNEAVAAKGNVLRCDQHCIPKEYEENTIHMQRGRVYTLFMVQGISILWMLPYTLSSPELRRNRIRTEF